MPSHPRPAKRRYYSLAHKMTDLAAFNDYEKDFLSLTSQVRGRH